MASIDTNQLAPKLLPSQGGDPAEFIPAAPVIRDGEVIAAQADAADWTEFYRVLSIDELVSRTISLRLAVQRGHALYVEERFAGLEAEQRARCIDDVWMAHSMALRIQDVTEAHEQAHRENERRWAAQQVAHIAVDDGEIIADLLTRTRRNWRLSRETANRADHATFTKFATWAGNAANELEAEYGVTVDWTLLGGWTVDFEACWTESGTDD